MSETIEPVGTTIPRWLRPDEPRRTGWVRAAAPVPPDVTSALRRLSVACHTDLSAVLFAAHLKVLRALSGERELVTAYRVAGATVHCATSVADGSWDALVDAAGAAIAAALPLPDVAAEALFEPRGLDGDPAAPVVLAVGYRDTGDTLTVDVVCRRDALSGDFAERVAGYQIAALTLMTADRTAAHERQSLLGADELAMQLTQLNGPDRPLPGPLFVELFEHEVALHPDATAASHGERRWTYAELNVRANRIAHELLDRGLHDEDVVAVAMERNLDWLAATLGVFKAGGVYLPVRPDFPADRVATQLVRSDCRYAVTEPVSEAVLHAAAARAGRSCDVVLVADAGGGRGDDPRRPHRPDQLAYIYFTSGSTGAPKGAMCEHEGMLNHLFMKVDDLRLGAGDVVTQTASQCFDISLWQLMAPLLVGGSTAIVDTDVQLDVDRFVDLVAAGCVHVIQIVPAYLDVLLSHVERDPRALGDLRAVSVTGEALKLRLVRRWFAAYPGITLVNAYGATEVSDDTMHAVLDRAPDRDLAIVCVGHSLRNVNTLIVDEHLRLVPFGAPGEIAFSGVCVGRGYINDPERTADAFTTDPYRPGTRLYRTGDFGRWLPEATIEFLGRRDEQVKIRGYRIEIGEVESRLLQMPGLDDTAVVIAGDSDQTKSLVAFYTGSAALQTADLRDFLAATLPDYMVPAYFRHLDSLPFNENGKVNKKVLTGLASTLRQDAAAYEPPATPTERRLATAWAEVLNVLVGRIGRDDDFFRLGGTSLAAVRLVVKLDRLVSLRQLVANPVLRDLATGIDDGAVATSAGAATSVLQRLSTPDGPASTTLVCFPYAGGNAVNFQQLARELAGAGVAVWGVEPPGHDVARPEEDLADVPTLARLVDRELSGWDPATTGPLMLWGHCAGAAHAVELARLLERAGRPPARVFLGAMMLDDPADLRRETAEVSALSNQEITSRLHDDSAYIELDLLKSERADLVGRAYRHDVCSTNDYFLNLQQQPPVRRLTTPVDAVVADDDPTTPGATERFERWRTAAETVGLHRIDEGGHYFIRSRAVRAAAAVTARVPAPAV